MSKSTLKILSVLMAASLLATLSARGVAPVPTSDIVTIGGTPFVILQDTPGQPAGSQFAPDFAEFGSDTPKGVVLFYQDAAMTVLSDQIWTVSTTNGPNVALNFASDPDLQDLSAMTVLARLVETGAPQDVSGYFAFPLGIIVVQSDVDVPDTGTTLSLFGFSLMGLAFLRRKLC